MEGPTCDPKFEYSFCTHAVSLESHVFFHAPGKAALHGRKEIPIMWMICIPEGEQ